MGKRLVVLPGYCEPEVLKSLLPADSQVLALTPMAMSVAETLGLHFITPDDFYRVEKYRNDLLELNRKAESLFANLDRICEKAVNFPLAFSGNIYWFQILFADFLYLTELSSRLRKQYTSISLIAESQKLNWERLNYRSLERLKVTHGFENKVSLLAQILNPEFLDFGAQHLPKIPPGVKWLAYLRKVPGGIKRRIFRSGREACRFHLNRLAAKKLPCIFVIQGGYELNNLRPLMSDYEWIDPVLLLSEKISTSEPVRYDFEEIRKPLHAFLVDEFHGSSDVLEGIFSRFYEEVIGRLTYWRSYLEDMIEAFKPKALFYSISATTIPEAMIAHLANARGIPIINFQHGGASVFTRHPYQKYLEANQRVKKILIINAKAEEKQAQHLGSECRVFGSSTRYKLLKDEPILKNNKVLYCCGGMPYFTYKELLFNESDAEYFKSSDEILRAASESSLHIDIKPHPSDEKYSYSYFSNLVKSNGYHNVKIIYGAMAENIIKSYGLIILEYLVSAIVPSIMGLKIPVILYLKDLSFVHEHVLPDLESRCYIIQDYASLVNTLRLHKANSLAPKWTEDFVDRYIYPTMQEDPIVGISGYIRGILDKSQGR
jgi:hypothetical protein